VEAARIYKKDNATLNGKKRLYNQVAPHRADAGGPADQSLEIQRWGFGFQASL
jgi:hypothetical protein